MPNVKITAVWIILCIATVVSISVSSASSTAGLGVAVLGVAFMKVYLVMHYFMELEDAPLAWRVVFAGWTLVVFLVLSILLWQGSQ